MASLYKKPVIMRDPKTGEKIKTKSRKWWGRFKDALGREKRVPLATDKMASQTMLSQLVKRVEREMAGLSDPTEEHLARPLAEHIRDFQQYLRDKGNTADYVDTTVRRVQDVVRVCKFRTIGDIVASRVQACLGDLRVQGKSIGTCNGSLPYARTPIKRRNTVISLGFPSRRPCSGHPVKTGQNRGCRVS